VADRVNTLVEAVKAARLYAPLNASPSQAASKQFGGAENAMIVFGELRRSRIRTACEPFVSHTDTKRSRDRIPPLRRGIRRARRGFE